MRVTLTKSDINTGKSPETQKYLMQNVITLILSH